MSMARNNKQPLNGIFTGKSGHHNGTHAGANGFVERPSAQSILNGIEHQFPGSRKAVKQSMGSRSVTNFPIDWKTLRSLKHPPYIDKREISDDDRRALEVLLGISAAVTIA
ncbi:MAG: hypothetical protein L6Q57_06995, partial [Alphaproteobacteria bacterium]|nr:hypothetical protein [Alphaproteobacteria bacterium]